MSWPTTADGLWYLFEGQVLIPVDPSTGMAQLLLRPQGGIGIGIPPIADGDPGAAAALVEGPIPFTELAPGDPTDGGLTVTEVSPGLYQLSGQLHRGNDGDETVTGLDMDSIGGTATAGNLIKVNSGATGFDYAFERVAERYLPASIISTSAGNTNSTLTTIAIPAKNVDYRVVVFGYQIVRQSGGSAVVVDLVARLNTEASGNIVARCQGLGGTERLTLASACPPASVDAFDKVTVAMGAANIYIRTEQQSGANTYTTSNSECLFEAWAIPIG